MIEALLKEPLPNDALEKLISHPYLPSDKTSDYTLVLDLDETLVHF